MQISALFISVDFVSEIIDKDLIKNKTAWWYLNYFNLKILLTKISWEKYHCKTLMTL